MRQCLQCGSYSPDHSQYCRNCGSSLTVGQTANRAATTQAPGQPPTVVRRRKYRVFIPGLGVFGFLKRDPQTGQWGCGPGCLISTFLAAVLVLGGFLFFSHRSPPGPANLSISGSVVPGGSIQVHGSNFPPQSTVGIFVDGAPSAFRGMSIAASIGDLFMQERQNHPSDQTVIVGSDGTFDTTIPVPLSWVPGSHHTIEAKTLNVQTSTQASIPVVTQSSNPTSTVPPPQQPVMQLSTTSLTFTATCPGPERLPPQYITITNAGGGTLTWMVGTPSPVQNGGPTSTEWLKASPGSGSDPAGGSSQITFAVPVTAFANKNYTATVDITSDGGTQTVTVTLNVQCIG